LKFVSVRGDAVRTASSKT